MSKRVLDVGQCGVDGPRLTELLEQELGATVTPADTIDEAEQLLQDGSFDLVLVNRKLAFEGSAGLDLIRAMREQGNGTPVMLVSDHADAQAEAERMGAVHGFGKSRLDDPATLKLLRDALG